jgi:hypothetical protein
MQRSRTFACCQSPRPSIVLGGGGGGGYTAYKLDAGRRATRPHRGVAGGESFSFLESFYTVNCTHFNPKDVVRTTINLPFLGEVLASRASLGDCAMECLMYRWMFPLQGIYYTSL